ncbi:cystathionine gamma-synthase [Paracoccus alcaliphilus]|uniref:Cystathionine gamma-synthase n=1 Tax=Paracoccus alcaliphilus TaxID=34002 RepID=A0A1H8NG79_9RHOB|nr:PLP-dependent aspartate aminotransferase family protein [Paracoccus alcaliphilus]WCR19589.1 PLP-dependent transferase [Paracoccus alcaliphilus]SEO28403.1 cystathionine gamma-synthase [Paracoccus alcaliphilus]
MRLQTKAIHIGRGVDPSTGAVSIPLHTSTTFERGADGAFPSGFEYTRDANPTRNAFEAAMAALEGGHQAIAFSSGMAAISAVIEGHPSRGRIVVPDDMYFGIRSLMDETDIGRRFDFVPVDMRDLDALHTAVTGADTGLVWIETPSNPLIRVVDIAAACQIANEAGALAVVDNTWATPVLQRPLEFGADAVMHSATKYIGGHSDLMAGVVVTPEGSPLERPLRMIQRHKGSVAAPFDCWLALRGLQTLPLRMEAHCEGARKVADALNAHRHVKQVLFPGLPDDPGHALATRQMSGYGAMLSFIVAGGAEAAMAVAGRLRLIVRATSLGGAHSLIEHRASVEGPKSMAPAGLLRVSVGLEHPQDIIDDLTQALDGLA